MDEERLTRQQASDAATPLGWRYILGVLRTAVRADSFADALGVARDAAVATGAEADGHLRLDVRPDGVDLTLQSVAVAAVTDRDVQLARRITAAVRARGAGTEPMLDRSVQLIEIAIDAMDIPAVRPFWKAVLDYADEPGRSGPTDPLVDPRWQGPAVWFQQMDSPRPQRNRIHLDVSVPHDEVARRMQAALEHGGVMVSDTAAPAFWVLADAEGNEACLTTWQGRD
ncbi:MAG TPA: VOC family protein [Mycobacteriales bacterium]|nr:VOC family protein [Mycobacteriales bacterium]